MATERLAISSERVTATYLYCVLHASRKPALKGVPSGLAHASTPELAAVSESLWLVSAAVPMDVYGPEPLERQLADIDWVGQTAVAHEAVVEFFAMKPGCTVVPMKLFTMFSTQARAVTNVRSGRRAIKSAVERIRGAEEWGVRVLRAASPSRQGPAKPGMPASGVAFLAAKKQARDQAHRGRAEAAEAALGAFDRLASLAKEVRRRDDAMIGAAAPPLLDAAFLVAAKQRGRFKAAAAVEADACAKYGATLMLTGPWPAYSFVQAVEG
jgi:hypothetical protein